MPSDPFVQNIYDNPTFFEGYRRLRETEAGLNAVLEQPAFQALLPEPGGLRILELGCGMGGLARRLAELGAVSVRATDVSERMLEAARRDNPHPAVVYERTPIEKLEVESESVDLIVSSLALHYVADYGGLVCRAVDWLADGGRFLFSVEHPIATALNPMARWIEGTDKERLYWPVDHYGEEGPRHHRWFVAGVRKYHRTLSTYLNTLVDSGLILERIAEPEAVPEAVAERPDLADERRRPPFLLVRSRKP